jgi:internalin A
LGLWRARDNACHAPVFPHGAELYLLVLSGRQGGEDAEAEYWLQLIESFGGDSPVIVVLNKISEHPFDLNRHALQGKYPSARDFIRVDCKDGTGIDDLRGAIYRETDVLKDLRTAFPASWVAIKDQLSNMAEQGDNYIGFERYRELCVELGEKDPEAQEALAGYLHSLGIALNYKDDPRLNDMNVLSPHWVTNGIYKILNWPELELGTVARSPLVRSGSTRSTKTSRPQRSSFC